MIAKKLSLALLVTCVLAACGSGLDGTYSATTYGMTYKLEFKSNGNVIQNSMGVRSEFKYEVDGKDLKLIAPQGTSVLRIIDEKTIEGPMGIRLVKS